MNNVGHVTFNGSYMGVGNRGKQAASGTNSHEYAPETGKEQQAQMSPDNVMDAMNIAGSQNKLQINQVKNKEVNPADFLSAERIADIEAMMEGFSKEAEVYADDFRELGFSEKNSNYFGAYAAAKDVNNAQVVISEE